MEFEYEDRMGMIKVIDSYLDIANYEHNRRNFILNSGKVVPNASPNVSNVEWYDVRKLVNEELRKKGFFSDQHTLFIRFDLMGKIEQIYIELEIPREAEISYDEHENEECTVTIKKTGSVVIDKKTELRFDFSPSEWKNFKRTELMDRMLDGK